MSREPQDTDAPLSVQLEGVLTPEQMRKQRATESAANARFVYAASNGIFGRIWSVAKELWLVIAFVWFVSDRWGGLEKRVADATAHIAGIQQSLGAIQANLIDVKVEQTRVRTQLEISLDRGDSERRRTTPVFGRP